MKTRNDLLLIDMQMDFCNPQGSLFVPGADKDSVRLATWIERNAKNIYQIHATLDSHQEVAIFHPLYWINSNGEHPAPFTLISYKDVMGGVWRTTIPSEAQWASFYTKSLEDGGKQVLVIWPPHCLIGKTVKVPLLGEDGHQVKDSRGNLLSYDFCGHAICEPVASALANWAKTKLSTVDYCVKGSNYRTEHYGAVQAEVIDPKDQSTQINSRFISTLEKADRIIVVGEALSHCVKETVGQIAKQFGNENVKKFCLLTDCCSNVPGFEKNGNSFVDEMKALGMLTAKSTDITL